MYFCTIYKKKNSGDSEEIIWEGTGVGPVSWSGKSVIEKKMI